MATQVFAGRRTGWARRWRCARCRGWGSCQMTSSSRRRWRWPGWLPSSARSAVLLAALDSVPVSDYERDVLSWVACWETHTVAVLAALVRRARRRNCNQLDRERSRLAGKP